MWVFRDLLDASSERDLDRDVLGDHGEAGHPAQVQVVARRGHLGEGALAQVADPPVPVDLELGQPAGPGDPDHVPFAQGHAPPGPDDSDPVAGVEGELDEALVQVDGQKIGAAGPLVPGVPVCCNKPQQVLLVLAVVHDEAVRTLGLEDKLKVVPEGRVLHPRGVGVHQVGGPGERRHLNFDGDLAVPPMEPQGTLAVGQEECIIIFLIIVIIVVSGSHGGCQGAETVVLALDRLAGFLLIAGLAFIWQPKI